MPDIEYSDVAVNIYKKNSFFKNWDCVYHYGGKVLCNPKTGEAFNADVMTGWWNPFKYFMGMNSRKDISENLLKMIPPKNDDDEIVGWLQEYVKDADDEDCRALIEFLKIVYTAGNIIPAPLNWKGQGMDAWDCKMTCILENILENNSGNKVTCSGAWAEYIKNEYRGENDENKLKDFIKVNKLEMYFKDSLLKDLSLCSLWGDEDKPEVWTKASKKQWKNYLNNARKCIIDRTNKLEK